MAAQTGGFLAQPPGLDGVAGMGLAGISGAPRGRTWDAVASAECPDLTGDAVTFVTLDDGTIVVDADLPEGSVIPLAESLETALDPPYRAAAVRSDGDLWTAAAESVRIVELGAVDGDVLELTVVGGERTMLVDLEPTNVPLPPLDDLAAEHGDVVVHAERVDDDLVAVDVCPL